MIFSILIIIAASAYGIADQRSHTYNTDLLLSGSETCGIEYDDSYSVSLADESYGTVSIGYEEAIESFLVRASFTKTGHTELILESPDGERHVYELDIERYSYEVSRKE